MPAGISEQHGKRGVYSRGLHEGGAQEHELAARARGWAKTVGHRWPRTRTMLKDIAEMWDDHAARQDEEVRRSKLME